MLSWKSRTTVAMLTVLVLAGCGTGEPDPAASDGTVTIAANTAEGKPVKLSVPTVAAIRNQLPAAVRDSGELVIGVGALPDGSPPLSYIGTDQQTLTGSEPDLGRLVAAVLGLTADVQNASWQNNFVRIQSGQFDAGFSNITVTEQRKDQGFDFASYRKDELAFETRRADTWNFTGDYEALAGKTVAVDSGTNQEKILTQWRDRLAAEGKELRIRNFGNKNGTYLALQSGRIDAYLATDPGITYHVTQTAKTPGPTRIAGTYSGAGTSQQGLIAATTKRGNGLAKPLATAIDYLIRHGQYAKWLAAYHLSGEAVRDSEVNPPGLPRSNS
ncbi:transporter substrate-binding domain-containing protein [Sciscionella marina]|uniref:transporter substrate-binding domain-containing protein n=1 Tax=Sciscionella marina TaxID=508770 RepID=UPI00035DE0AE|nr:transporter substrate-binding domain-containing protein [Sciscionella marina]